MRIGDAIKINAEVVPYYDTDAGETKNPKLKRLIGRQPFRKPIRAFYTGYTYRFEGEIQPGTVDKLRGNTEPNYLGKVQAKMVVRFKTTERGNERFAFPEDVDVIIPLKDPDGAIVEEKLVGFPFRGKNAKDKD